MKKILNIKLACDLLISLLIILLIFHLLVLLKVIPYDIIWGGQITDSFSLIIYEGIAIFLTIIFILIIALKAGYIIAGRLSKVINITAWLVFGYFLFNTIGNLTSAVNTEKLIFTPVTMIMTILAFRVAIGKR